MDFPPFIQGRQLCVVLFDFVPTRSLLKRGLYQKERICYHREENLSFKRRYNFRKEATSFGSKSIPLNDIYGKTIHGIIFSSIHK